MSLSFGKTNENRTMLKQSKVFMSLILQQDIVDEGI